MSKQWHFWIGQNSFGISIGTSTFISREDIADSQKDHYTGQEYMLISKWKLQLNVETIILKSSIENHVSPKTLQAYGQLDKQRDICNYRVASLLKITYF